ncbi:MAG: VOC family protein [Ferruginibacter sp.]
MKSIHPYLTFSGNCKQVMKFYQSCLGGKLSLQYVGDTDLAENLPAKMKNCILQAILKTDNLMLYGTDMTGDNGLLKGNNISLLLHCKTENEIKGYYKSLSRSGKQTHPLKETYHGNIFGGLTDKFGNHWLLSYEKKQRRKVLS